MCYNGGGGGGGGKVNKGGGGKVNKGGGGKVSGDPVELTSDRLAGHLTNG